MVSCIMPCNRPEDLPKAISGFKAQDYPDKELIIIIDDWEDHKIPVAGESVRYFILPGSIGARRNKACELAHGDIICHMDSDDYYATDWITKSLIGLGKNDLTGLKAAYFASDTQAWYYEYLGSQGYVIGATMMYRRSLWERNKFLDTSQGEDTMFCANGGRIKAHNYVDGFVARIHGKNTASHNSLKFMKEIDRALVKI